MYSDLLGLRKRELEYLGKEEERLALRLEIARLGEIVETRTERFEMLLSNLEECPGHGPTLKALDQLLRTRGRYLELADIMTTQARKLESLGDLAGASRRWHEVAVLFESQLADEAQAIAAYEKVVTLSNDPKALEALSRLFESLGEPLQAANWLEQRLAMGETAAKQQAVTRLAELYLKGGQKHRAVVTLERVLGEDPKVDALWVMLAKLHRESEHHEALVQVLTQRAVYLNDPEALLATAREVLTLCQEKLHDPVRAIPVLERALVLVPSDRDLRFSLAAGLSIAGRFAEARQVLEVMLEGFGRRQSRERANLHLQIARVARAEKDLPLAAKHLEQAAQVLLDNIEVQLALAEVAEERGEIERAEKGYRALLVLARRSHDAEAVITAGEVHLRMRRLCIRQNQTAQAASNLEAAISRALHDPVEARRIQAALLAEGEYDRLLDLIAKRRAQATQVVDEVVLIGEQAMALEAMGKGAEAFAVLMAGLTLAPDHSATHTMARQLAKRLNQPSRYLDAVTQAVEKLRRSDDSAELADLFLRSAAAAEEDLHDPNRALEYLHRTEQTKERLPEVLAKIIRLSAQIGDAVESRRATTLLQRMLKASSTVAEKAEVAYSLAEGLLGQEATRDEGLDALSLAVETLADLPRAMALVQNAKVPDSALIRVLPVYEKVARSSKNERLLLDFYERRAVLPDTLISDLRDGVALAVTLGEGERAERLLAQAIVIGHRTSLHDAVWAVLDLSRRLRARGELAKSAEVLLEARDEWTNPRLTPMVRETARAASAESATARIAAQLYEQLHVLYPADRDIWEPLATLYARLEDRPHLEALTRDLTGKLMGRNDRSAVRMAWARYLLAHGDTSDAVASTLRDVLMEEPGQFEALTLLADFYEKRGDVGEAVTLLSDTLASTEGAIPGAGRATLARRLGDLVKRADPAHAKEVYRSALATTLPDVAIKRSLQLALLELLNEDKDGVERASLLEDILLGESGDLAAQRALEVFELRLKLNDDLGAKRVLELGYERAPGNSVLVEQLGWFYTQRELWGDAVNLFSAEAAHTTDPEQATVLFRKVARIQRGKLGDAQAASHTLRQATLKNPTDLDLIQELAETMIAAGDLLLAIASVGEILATTQAKDLRIALLRLRADLAARNRDDEAAVRDLEEALTLGAEGLEIDLAAALSRVAGRASAAQEIEKAREATLRLAEVLRDSGDAAQADQVLFRWIESTPDDRGVLYQLRDRFTHEEKWEEAITVWERLVHLEVGEEKIDAVLTLSELFEHLGRPEEALPWLNGVLTSMPDHRGLKTRMADLYEVTGNAVESARLRYAMAETEPDETVRFNVFLQIGQSLLAIGQGAEAAMALERAMDLPAADRNTKILLLDAYTLSGRFDRAAVILEHLLAGSKTIRAEEVATLYQRQSRLCAAMGDRDGQLAAMKKALDTDRKSVAIANELADLAESMGDDDLALRALRVVAASPGKDGRIIATAYLRQARIAHRAHDRSRAIIFVKRALQEDPELAEAKALLEQLR
jgi:tetratricopeptide (TPR) repeat protein